MNMNPLINIEKEAFQPLADVANNLIDKMAAAAGWIVTPKGKKKDADAAVESYINSLKENKELTPLMRAALISEARKTLKQYVNINDIVNLAIEQIDKNANLTVVDDDWMMYFSEHAKNISKAEVQIMWGRILAEECNHPGSISKLLMHTLSVMTLEQAEAFNNLLAVCVEIEEIDGDEPKEVIPMIFNVNETEKYGLSYNNLVDLASIGLIEINALAGYKHSFGNKETRKKLILGEHVVEIVDKDRIKVGQVIFTNQGDELSKIIDRKVREDYFEEIQGYLNTDYVQKV